MLVRGLCVNERIIVLKLEAEPVIFDSASVGLSSGRGRKIL